MGIVPGQIVGTIGSDVTVGTTGSDEIIGGPGVEALDGGTANNLKIQDWGSAVIQPWGMAYILPELLFVFLILLSFKIEWWPVDR